MKDGFNMRQKRNKPCENCRTHRRKCVNFNNSTCERCSKLNLDCVYKLTEKPTKLMKPSISPAKRNKLFEAIWSIKEKADNIQLQLKQIKDAATEQPCHCQDPTHCKHVRLLPSSTDTTWNLAISNNGTGIQLQTSIQSLSDLCFFVQDALSVFLYGNKISQEFPEKFSPPKQLLTVTHKSLQIEEAFRSVFNIQQEPPPLPTHDNQEILLKQIRFLKLQMIKVYFNCHALIDPVFVHTWHYPHLCKEPDSLLSTSVAALVAYSSCTHIDMSGLLFTRMQFAELCRQDAIKMLQELLFESGPDIDICLALWVLHLTNMLALKTKEARIYSGLCWRMAIELKATYLNRALPDTLVNMINAEVWKRLFFASRYIEFNMRMKCDGATDFSNITHHMDVDLPSLLPCEVLDDRLTKAVLSYQYVCRLTSNSAGFYKENNETEILGLRLMAGVIDSVPSNILQHIEYTLMQLWDSIPQALRLGGGPYRLIDPACLEECRNPSMLRFNLVFYIYWMNLQSRVMQRPDSTDLTAAVFSRMDGDRALIITSICSDAASKLFKVMSVVMPCGIELHWITMCLDILRMLSSSANIPVKQRAEKNLLELAKVLANKLNGLGEQSTYAFASEAPYLTQIKKRISTYMHVNNILCTID